MGRKERIEREVEQTMEWFHHSETIEADPFFYSRLQTKIAQLEKNRVPSSVFPSWREYWQPALLIVILLINIFSGIFVFIFDSANSHDRASDMTEFVQEYSLNQKYNQLYALDR